MSEEEIKKIAKAEFINNVMKQLDSTLIFTYIQKLEQQLQQKENIIKEVREFVEKHKQKGYRIPMSDDFEFWNELNENEIKELLEILDKGE